MSSLLSSHLFFFFFFFFFKKKKKGQGRDVLSTLVGPFLFPAGGSGGRPAANRFMLVSNFAKSTAAAAESERRFWNRMSRGRAATEVMMVPNAKRARRSNEWILDMNIFFFYCVCVCVLEAGVGGEGRACVCGWRWRRACTNDDE